MFKRTNYVPFMVLTFRTTSFYPIPGFKTTKKSHSPTCSPKRAIVGIVCLVRRRLSGLAGKQFKTDTPGHGLIPAVSTKRTTLNSRRLSILCSVGTKDQRHATFTSLMLISQETTMTSLEAGGGVVL